MSDLTTYVLGFAFSENGAQVLLLQKARPAWARSKWNGIGGHVEVGETFLQAMVREFEEESGLIWPASCWEAVGELGDETHFRVLVYAAAGDISLAKSMTDEPVRNFPLGEVAHLDLMPDVTEILTSLQKKGWGVWETHGQVD